MKTAVIYARYSSDRQTEQSIEGQLRVCQDFAQKENIVIVDTYIDRAMSGTNDNRFNFQRMIKDSSKRAWDYVLIYKLDRFSRNKYEMAMHRKTLKDNGVKVLSATENIPDTPEGIILESLLEGMAEYYSVELSQKVKRGLKESRIKGLFTGGHILFGYKVENKKIVIDEEKAKVIQYIFDKHIAGMYIKDIVSELTKNGIYNNGKPFAINTVHNFLRNEKYAGIVRHGNEVYTNIYPPIVSEEIFQTVRQKMLDNHYGKHTNEIRYLLKNKLKCGLCGRSIASETGTSRTGEIVRYYKCSGRKKDRVCNKQPVKKEILEQIVIDTTFKIFENNENLNILADKILDLHNKKLESSSLINYLEKDRFQIKTSIDNLIKCMEQGIITPSTKNRLEELETRLSEVESQILLESSKQKISITKEDIVKFIRTSLKKEANVLIDLLINKIILYDHKIEIYYNYTNTKNTLDIENQECSFFNDYFETEVKTGKKNCEDTVVYFDIVACI